MCKYQYVSLESIYGVLSAYCARSQQVRQGACYDCGMGPLDKFKPVHAAPTETGAGGTPEESVEQPLEAYSASLKGYVEKRRELHEYRRRNEAVLSDPEIFKESLLLDREVNHAPENLKDAGKIVGKNEYDIIVDILRQEGTLSEAFGLAEFF